MPVASTTPNSALRAALPFTASDPLTSANTISLQPQPQHLPLDMISTIPCLQTLSPFYPPTMPGPGAKLKPVTQMALSLTAPPERLWVFQP